MLLTVPVLAIISLGLHAQTPSLFIERSRQIPDVMQSLVVHDSQPGEAYCAPAAVSNSLCYLASHGYPKLMRGNPHDESDHILLARSLASAPYMQTTPEAGTSKERLIVGVRAYVRDRGYRDRTVEYRGLEIYHDPARPPSWSGPELEWLKSRLAAGGSCWLQVGWYRRNGDDYRKMGGHWVTLTGYGADANGAPDPEILIVRDPSPRAGPGPSNEYLRARVIARGTIHGWGLPQSASGFFNVSDGIALPPDSNIAILEGAVVLELDPP